MSDCFKTELFLKKINNDINEQFTETNEIGETIRNNTCDVNFDEPNSNEHKNATCHYEDIFESSDIPLGHLENDFNVSEGEKDDGRKLKCKQMFDQINDFTPIYVDEPSISNEEQKNLETQEFIENCIGQRLWAEISNLFMTQGTKGSLSNTLLEALTNQHENAGICYQNLADAINNNETELPFHHRTLFCQIGAALMLRTYSKKYMSAALKILHVLHMHNLNYYQMQAPAYAVLPPQILKQHNIFLHCSEIAFIAIDLCLHFKRPKDAYNIFKSFSWLSPDKDIDHSLKCAILEQRLKYLYKLAWLLKDNRPLNNGLSLLSIFLHSAEKDFSVDYIKGLYPELSEIYNHYLIQLMNANKVCEAQKLFANSLGPCKDMLIVQSCVIRGLIVMYRKSKMFNEARNLFDYALMMKIYHIEKPLENNLPWTLHLMCSWTTVEMNFVIHYFLKYLNLVLMAKWETLNQLENFSWKLIFTKPTDIDCVINCLKDSFRVNCAMKRAVNVLKKVNPNAEYFRNSEENSLSISLESFYHFWKKDNPKHSKTSPSMMSFKCSSRGDLPFGKDSSLTEAPSDKPSRSSGEAISPHNVRLNMKSNFSCKTKESDLQKRTRPCALSQYEYESQKSKNMEFENFTISLVGNSSERVVISSSSAGSTVSPIQTSNQIDDNENAQTGDISPNSATVNQKLPPKVQEVETSSSISPSAAQQTCNKFKSVNTFEVSQSAEISSMSQEMFLNATPEVLKNMTSPVFNTSTSSMSSNNFSMKTTSASSKSFISHQNLILSPNKGSTVVKNVEPLQKPKTISVRPIPRHSVLSGTKNEKDMCQTKYSTKPSASDGKGVISEADRESVVTFLQRRLSLKYTNLAMQETVERASVLADQFILQNCISTLDRAAKKALCDFANNNV